MSRPGDPLYQQPVVEFLSRALVLPLTGLAQSVGGAGGTFDGAAYYSDGRACPLSLQIKAGYRNIPVIPDLTGSEDHLQGSFIFGGLLQNEHFGHFIAESLSRLWAIHHLGATYRGAIFYKRHPELPLSRYVAETIGTLFPGIEVRIAERATRIERLAVPSQLVHADNGYLYGHELARQMFTSVSRYNKYAPRKLYVSRARLPANKGAILCERLLEANLQAEGYTVVHPEMLHIREQFEIFHSADKIIFADGSAIHLYSLVARPEQSIFVVWRRRPTWSFGWQIKTFGGGEIKGNPCVKRYFTPRRDGGNMVHAKVVLDYDKLREQLITHDFIAGTAWNEVTDEDVGREIAALSGDLIEMSFE